MDALGVLEREPESGHELRGRLRDLRSYRVGAYRIIYQLQDEKTVRVVAIRHRDTDLRNRSPLEQRPRKDQRYAIR